MIPLEKPGSAYVGALYRNSIWYAVAALASVPLGIARAAIDELVQAAKRKTPSYTQNALKQRSVVQRQIAEAEGHLGAGRAYLHRAIDETWQSALEGNTINTE